MSGTPITALSRARRLVAGDRVAVVATSAPLDADRLDRGVATLRGWGLEVVVGQHALDRDRHLAGLDADRAADLEAAWCDPKVAAVLVARGGSGAARLLDLLDWDGMRRAEPAVLVGFSDATALHEAWATHLGVSTLWGPMPATAMFGGEQPDATTVDHLRTTLFEPEQACVLRVPDPRTHVAGRARGVLVGGTLARLSAAIGTPESRPAHGGIALIEDVDEAPYRLDNMLTQLLRTGWFEGVRGIVLGYFTGCGPEAVDVVADRLAALGVPLVSGLPFGHDVPSLTVPLGLVADLDTDAGTLTLAEPALT